MGIFHDSGKCLRTCNGLKPIGGPKCATARPCAVLRIMFLRFRDGPQIGICGFRVGPQIMAGVGLS